MVNADTLQHSNVKEIDSESICHATWNKLQLTEAFLAQGFTEEEAKLAITQVISRAVYPASELKTTRWIKDNSVVCELTGYDIKPNNQRQTLPERLTFISGKRCAGKTFVSPY